MVLGSYGVDWLKRSGSRDQLRGRCPLHGRGGGDAFHVSLSRNAFHCFYCQAQGNVLDFVAAREKCSIREAALWLQERFGNGAALVCRTHGPPEPKLVPEKQENPLLGFRLTGVDGRHPYLAQRGIEATTADYFGVGFYPRRGMLSGRIVIPIHDRAGRLVAYCGRAMDGAAPKYKLPSGFRKSLVLYNLHRAASYGQEAVIVVEGFFDCMKVQQAGFPAVVALMGTALSENQASLLEQYFREAILLLDGDTAGRRATQAIMHRLSGRVAVRIATTPLAWQPDQMSPAEIQQILRATR